jgi:hypothetical protein
LVSILIAVLNFLLYKNKTRKEAESNANQ